MSGSTRLIHRNMPLPAAERIPLTLSVTMRNNNFSWIGRRCEFSAEDSGLSQTAAWRIIPARRPPVRWYFFARDMDPLRQQFIEFALAAGVLRFCEFVTKA